MTSDRGKTWRDVTPSVAGTAYTHVYSLDPYLYADRHADAERIFAVDLTAACAILSFSDNAGKSWTTNPMACGEPVNDHQTLFSGKPVNSTTLGYPNVLYYCFSHPVFTKCSRSIDGGLSFVPTAQVLPPDCGGLTGHGVTDSKGTVYLPMGQSCSRPRLAISKDEGDTWDVVEVADSSLKGDPSVAVDSKGNLYYLWIDGEARLPRLSISRNGGKTWTAPMVVSPRGVRAANLATLDVGKPGRVAIAYYGTTDPDDPEVGWNGYLVSVVDALSKRPTFYTATVNDPRHPLKVGECGGGQTPRCGRVLDFIDVEIAPDGQPWGAYVDACLAACEKTKEEDIADNEGVVGTLVGGPRL